MCTNEFKDWEALMRSLQNEPFGRETLDSFDKEEWMMELTALEEIGGRFEEKLKYKYKDEERISAQRTGTT